MTATRFEGYLARIEQNDRQAVPLPDSRLLAGLLLLTFTVVIPTLLSWWLQ